jgi:hypothetical protein
MVSFVILHCDIASSGNNYRNEYHLEVIINIENQQYLIYHMSCPANISP